MSIRPARRKGWRWLLLMASLAVSDRAWADEPVARATAEQLQFFEARVRPLLAEHCYACHSGKAKKLKAGLFVDSRAGLLRGGDEGPAIVPGDPESSLLMEAVRYESYEMPPKGKLPAKDVKVLAEWIRMGAPWPEEEAPVDQVERPEFDLEARRREHWVWQPIRNPPRPEVRNAKWARRALDDFVLAELESVELTPATDVDRAGLLRRLHLDITGLPPTPKQVAAFVADDSPEALEDVVDELLDSPRFGERWGRHWLDLVRYAESRGHEFDNDTPNAFQYRDYVIRALNADVPYDQFVREHVAGDLLTNPRLHPQEGWNESVLGTGFWYLGEWVHSPVDTRKDEADRFDNMIDVMSKTFLGVTVSCARCHDHKFDAISTADYYSLSGFLQSSDYRQVRFESMEANREVAGKLAELDRRYRDQLRTLLRENGIDLPEEPAALGNEAIVVDYSSPSRDEYLQDGFVFGAGPQGAGEASLRPDGAGVEITTFGSARNDPFWYGLKSITEGAVQNRSSLAKLPKSGRALRTPTFEVTDGNVACRVRGEGHVVACVDSHRLVAGPLHGRTIVPVKPGTEWVKLNLRRYVGHRMHLEFVPAVDRQMAVRLVTQGLDAAGLADLDRRLAATDEPFEAYAAAAETLLNGRRAGKVESRVFADFESGTYDGWTVTGEAFGKIPQTLETIAAYQGRINGRGTFFVNSHNVRPGGDVARGDSLTGTLTSAEFPIEFDTIEFLVGGGNHAGKTCVDLVVDGKTMLSATGRANNRMFLNTWDVRRFAGKKARIRVIDDETSGWGNIGIDHIVFKTFVPNRATREDEENSAAGTEARDIVRAWRREREELASQIVRKSRVAPAMMDGTGEDDRVLIRGNPSKPGKVEPRHFLTAVTGDEPMAIASGSGRLELAAAINDPANPLMSRVIVNRIWHHLMGRGIVPTTDDFGVLGQRPTHPELLDHLATRFLANGRSIKGMIREIVLSRTYRMSTVADPGAVELDPTNRLWHHRPPKRLEGEAIRDTLLALSGRLDTTMFGPPVPIHLTPFMDGRGRPRGSGPLDGHGRRSIYISVRRNFLSPFMLAFDTPVPFSTMGRRNVSNVPAQALILMNDPFVVDRARGWAERAIASGDDAEARVRWLYRSGFAREPTEAELSIALEFVGDGADADRWADLAHGLINTKEFVFLR